MSEPYDSFFSVLLWVVRSKDRLESDLLPHTLMGPTDINQHLQT